MASDFVGIEIQGLEEIQRAMIKLAPEAIDEGVDEANKYALNVLRTYPPKKYVSRRQAYGVTFFSDRQRRYFFAALGRGEIQVPYRRTQQLSKGWKVVGQGKSSFIANETPYASLVMGGPGEQSRHPAAIGWKSAENVIKERAAQLVEKFNVGVKRAIKRLRLG